MASYNKSFNFRNGVQVDDDNFIVNANGLVGIGTSIPREFLDVHGTAKVTGLVTATNLAITGVSTFYSDVKIGSGITFNPSTGAVRATTFFGDGSTLSNIVGFSTNAWILNIAQTGLSTSLNIGIGTQALDAYDLLIGSDPLVSEGISFDGSTGNINSSGIVTASSFSGDLTGNVTGNINSIGVSTFSTLKVGTGVTINGGIVTATTFVGALSGTATSTTNVPNLTGAITSNNTTTSLGSFTSAQLATALSDETGSGANVFSTSPTLVTPVLGNATATSIVVGSGVAINSGGIIASTGIITASGFVGTLTGSVVGIASTARDLTSDARVSIAHIASQSSSIGVSTVSTRLYAESIGVGTNSPSSDIHIRRSSTSTLQVTSDTAEAIVAVGRSTTLTGNNGALRFGNTSGIYPYSNSRTLDIINYGTGNLNHYLNYSAGGGNIGDFNWIYAPDATNPLMTLTYQGNLGLGVTDPTVKLQISGIASVTSLVTQDITATGDLSVISAGSSVSIRTLYVLDGPSGILDANGISLFEEENVNIISGVSTFFDINVTNNGTFSQRIGIGNTNPLELLHIGGGSIEGEEDSVVINGDGIGIGTTSIKFGLGISAEGKNAIFGSVGIGITLQTENDLDILEEVIFFVNGPSSFGDNVGIGTSIPTNKLTVVGDSQFYGNLNTSGVTTSQNGFTSGIGVTNPVKITVSGSILTFTVAGVGSTSLTLY
jgi:hypothetical protein